MGICLPVPEEVAAQVIELCNPAFTDNGAVYKYAPQGLFRFEP